MRLIELDSGVAAITTDRWTHVDGDAPLPPEGPATIPLARWKAERDSLRRRNIPIGIRLQSHERLEDILPDLSEFALIALDFSNLNDGRHYTTARLLRTRYGYEGRIRATGEVLRDQLELMRRCGFDAFELPAGKNAEAALAAFGEIRDAYQPAADSRPTISDLRRERRESTGSAQLSP